MPLTLSVPTAVQSSADKHDTAVRVASWLRAAAPGAASLTHVPSVRSVAMNGCSWPELPVA